MYKVFTELTPDLFLRDPAHPFRPITPVITSGCWWVSSGHGEASRLYSGLRLALTRTYEGQPLQMDQVPVDDGSNSLMWMVHRGEAGWKKYPYEGSALERIITGRTIEDPTYAATPGFYWLCGPDVTRHHAQLFEPGVNHNVEDLNIPMLIAATDAEPLPDAPTAFAELIPWLVERHTTHGVLWTHPDGRTARLMRKDALHYHETSGWRRA